MQLRTIDARLEHVNTAQETIDKKLEYLKDRNQKLTGTFESFQNAALPEA